jgi:hypothetical protein
LRAEQWFVLQEAVGGFEVWLMEIFTPLSVFRELPVLYQSGQGNIVSGVVDLLVEEAGGFWIDFGHPLSTFPPFPFFVVAG